MNLAEQLRNEASANLLKDMPWLSEQVADEIRRHGKFGMICDNHISKITRGWAAPYKYWSPISDWARKQGFNVYADYNSYGVRSICITL